MLVISGAKAPVAADTCFVMDTFTAAAKAVLIEAETAGLKACSTLWDQNFPGLKPQVSYAANGTAPQPSLAELAQAKRSSRALTLVSPWTLLPHRLKPIHFTAETAGINACSTPQAIQQSWDFMAVAPTGVR